MEAEGRARLPAALDFDAGALQQQAQEHRASAARLHAEAHEAQQAQSAELRQLAAQASQKIAMAADTEAAAAAAVAHHQQLAEEAARLEVATNATLGSTPDWSPRVPGSRRRHTAPRKWRRD